MSLFRYFVKSRTTATLQHWPARLVPPPRASSGAPKRRHCSTVSENVFDGLRNDDADRHLAVVGAVGCIERAAAVIEPNLALDALPEVRPSSACASAEGYSATRGRAQAICDSCSSVAINLVLLHVWQFAFQSEARTRWNPGGACHPKARGRHRRTSARSGSGRKNTRH